MNAAFCCASLGIVPTVRHADYIGSSLEVLREDRRRRDRRRAADPRANRPSDKYGYGNVKVWWRGAYLRCRTAHRTPNQRWAIAARFLNIVVAMASNAGRRSSRCREKVGRASSPITVQSARSYAGTAPHSAAVEREIST